MPAHPDEIRYPGLAFEVPDPTAFRTVLPNGAVVYIAEDHEAPVVEISVTIRGGSAWEPAGKEGLAEATGSVMRSGGTVNVPAEALDGRLEYLAASVSTSFGFRSGSASFFVLRKDLEEGLDLFFDVLRRPAFRQDKFDLWRERTMKGIESRNDATSSIEGREWSLALYGDHPLNRLPTKASVASLTRDDLVAFHAAHLFPGNLILAVSGDFDRAAMLAALEKRMSGWENRPLALAPIPPPGKGLDPGVYFFPKKGVNQGRVTIGHMGILWDNPDRWALQVLNFILGGGSFTSRITGKVRSDEGLAYSVGTRLAPGRYVPGEFTVRYQSKSASCAYAAALSLGEIETIRSEPVTPEELRDAKNFYVESFPRQFGSKRSVVETFATLEYDEMPLDWYKSYREKVEAVTAEDVLRVAKEYLRPEKFIVVVVGDLDAIRAGDPKHPATFETFGKVVELPLSDPFTLVRPAVK